MSDIAETQSNFKTALPPRKRAKTKEEKEQRRVERILRNRKAAHASREKKRKHVEFLESYVLELEKQLHLVNKLNSALLKNHCPGGDADVDRLVQKVHSLPDLKQTRIEFDHDKSPSPDASNLPKTPESFSSGSPKSSGEEEYDQPSLSDPNSSISNDSEFDLAPSNPDYMDADNFHQSNKFSLDIITGESHTSDEVIIKQENDGFPQQLPLLDLNEHFIKKEEENVGLPSFNDEVGLFDFQVNANDEQFEFNELRNPEEITVSNDETKITMRKLKVRSI